MTLYKANNLTQWMENATILPAETTTNHQERRTTAINAVAAIVLFLNGFTIIVLAMLLHRFKHRKVLKAASPLILSIILIGSVINYSVIIAAFFEFAKSLTVCIIMQWLRVVGFTAVYGSLGLKTWRVSVILRFHKSRLMHTRDKELLLRLAFLLTMTIVFLTVQTFYKIYGRHDHDEMSSQSCNWRLDLWTFITLAGELVLLLWVGAMCYKTRYAPVLYNESVTTGLAVWNQALWTLAFIITRHAMKVVDEQQSRFLAVFLDTEFTVTPTLLLVFLPKFAVIMRKTRTAEGTLTDVHGPMRVHRLTLVINKTGNVKTINCIPCGPLQDLANCAIDGEAESEMNETRETEYSKEEVNALIELTSKLKSEREYYKKQLKEVISEVTTMKNETSDQGNTLHSQAASPSPSLAASFHSRELVNSPAVKQNEILPRTYWLGNLFHNDVFTSRMSVFPSPSDNGVCSPSCSCLLHKKQMTQCMQCKLSSTQESLNTVATSLSYDSVVSPESSTGTNENKPSFNGLDCDFCKGLTTTGNFELPQCICRRHRNFHCYNQPMTCQSVPPQYKSLHRLSWHAPSLFTLTNSKIKKTASTDTMALTSCQPEYDERTSFVKEAPRRPHSLAIEGKSKPSAYVKTVPIVFHI